MNGPRLLNLLEVRLGQSLAPFAPLHLPIQTFTPRLLPLRHQLGTVLQSVYHSSGRGFKGDRFAFKVNGWQVIWKERRRQDFFLWGKKNSATFIWQTVLSVIFDAVIEVFLQSVDLPAQDVLEGFQLCEFLA